MFSTRDVEVADWHATARDLLCLSVQECEAVAHEPWSRGTLRHTLQLTPERRQALTPPSSAIPGPADPPAGPPENPNLSRFSCGPLGGESGTGKDLAAKVILYSSSRASKPFMNITCSALPEALLESELFGRERGVFLANC